MAPAVTPLARIRPTYIYIYIYIRRMWPRRPRGMCVPATSRRAPANCRASAACACRLPRVCPGANYFNYSEKNASPESSSLSVHLTYCSVYLTSRSRLINLAWLWPRVNLLAYALSSLLRRRQWTRSYSDQACSLQEAETHCASALIATNRKVGVDLPHCCHQR